MAAILRIHTLLIAASALAGAGCAQIHRTPDQCAYSLDRCEFIRELDCLLDCHCGGGCSSNLGCAHEVIVPEEVCEPPAACGPPLVRYQPPTPPTFLLVPTRPAYSEVSADAPLPVPGSMEVGYRSELIFPGRD